MHFWTEEIGPSVADEWTVLAAGAKASPAVLPAATCLPPLMCKSKIVWPHRVKHRKEVHLREGALTAFLQDSITHAGLSRLPTWVCGETSQQQTLAVTMSFCFPTCWGVMVLRGKEGCWSSIRQPHGPYNLLPYINWNKQKQKKTISRASLELPQHSSAVPDLRTLKQRFGVDSREGGGQLCTLLTVEHFTKEHYSPTVVLGPDTSK